MKPRFPWIAVAFWCWAWTVVVSDLVLTSLSLGNPTTGAGVEGWIFASAILGVNLIMDPIAIARDFMPPLSMPGPFALYWGTIATGIGIGYLWAMHVWTGAARDRRNHRAFMDGRDV